MKEKIKILCFECKKCNKRVYFRSNEEYFTQCKTCKNEMKFVYEHVYRPKDGLQAIKVSNTKNKNNSEFWKNTKPVVECPYCHSTDTKKITNASKAVHTAIFGIFSIGRNAKNYHCNQCRSDF